MQAHPEIGLLGTFAERIDAAATSSAVWRRRPTRQGSRGFSRAPIRSSIPPS